MGEEHILYYDSGLRRDVIFATIYNILEGDHAKHITPDQAQKAMLTCPPFSMNLFGTNFCYVHPQMPQGAGRWQRQALQEAMFVLARNPANFYGYKYHSGDERIVSHFLEPFERNLVARYFPPYFMHPHLWLFIRLVLLFFIIRIFIF